MSETSKEKSIKLRNQSVIIDPKIKLKKIEKEEADNNLYRCSCCGKIYSKQYGNFPKSNSILFEGNNGYITICKNCVEKYYQQLIGFYSGNEEHAIERCCELFDWYYNIDAASMTRSNPGGKSRVLMYPSKMNMVQIKNKGTTYLDTIKDKHNNAILPGDDILAVDVPTEQTEEAELSVDKEVIKFFGYGYTNEDYLYLQEQYKDWSTRYDCKSKAQEELFKNICVSQLVVQKAQRKGNVKEISDAMKTFQDLLGSANIKPSQNNDNALIESNTLGTLIKKFENEEPIPEAKEEWKDVDGIYKYIDTYFLGHLCNLTHIKNDNEKLYRDEMKKHTVTPPVYEEDEDAETSLLDKFSDKDKADNKNE